MIKFEINVNSPEDGQIVLDKLRRAIEDTPEFNIDTRASERLGVVYRPSEDKVIVMLGRPAVEPNADICLGLNVEIMTHSEGYQLNLPFKEDSKQLTIPYDKDLPDPTRYPEDQARFDEDWLTEYDW